MLNRDLADTVVHEIAHAIAERDLPEPTRWDTSDALPDEIAHFYRLVGMDLPKAPARTFPQQWEERPDIEAFVRATNAHIVHDGGAQAYYHAGEDMIHLPDRGRFPTADAYYATLLHELTHWTRHEKRLHRPNIRAMGDANYCMEELVAELGSALLMRSFGLHFPAAYYIDHYLQGLGHSVEAFTCAASHAVQAADYLNHFCGH